MQRLLLLADGGAQPQKAGHRVAVGQSQQPVGAAGEEVGRRPLHGQAHQRGVAGADLLSRQDGLGGGHG
nr:hypothetical protein [Chromobacterium violaceum]